MAFQSLPLFTDTEHFMECKNDEERVKYI